jgi:glutamine synthetase
MLDESPNSKLNKNILSRFADLELPDGQIIATYIWIGSLIIHYKVLEYYEFIHSDGTGENVRCKDRTLDSLPTLPQGKLFDL